MKKIAIRGPIGAVKFHPFKGVKMKAVYSEFAPV